MTTTATEATTLPQAHVTQQISLPGVSIGDTFPFFRPPDTETPVGCAGALLLPLDESHGGWEITDSHPTGIRAYRGSHRGWWVTDGQVTIEGEVEVTTSSSSLEMTIQRVPEEYRADVPPTAYWVRTTVEVDALPIGEFLAIDGEDSRGPILLAWPGHPEWNRFGTRAGVPAGWRGWWSRGHVERVTPEPTTPEPTTPETFTVGQRVIVVRDGDEPVNNGRFAVITEIEPGSVAPFKVVYDNHHPGGEYGWWVNEVTPLTNALFERGTWVSWDARGRWYRTEEARDGMVRFDRRWEEGAGFRFHTYSRVTDLLLATDGVVVGNATHLDLPEALRAGLVEEAASGSVTEPPFVPDGARRVLYNGASARVPRGPEYMAIPADGTANHLVLLWPGHPSFDNIADRLDRVDQYGVPAGWRSYMTHMVTVLGAWAGEEQAVEPEPTEPEQTYAVGDRVEVIYGHGWNGPGTIREVDAVYVTVQMDADQRRGSFERANVRPLFTVGRMLTGEQVRGSARGTMFDRLYNEGEVWISHGDQTLTRIEGGAGRRRTGQRMGVGVHHPVHSPTDMWVSDGWRYLGFDESRVPAEPTSIRIEDVPDEHAASVPEGATWVTFTNGSSTAMPRGRYLAIVTTGSMGQPTYRTLLLWPGHPNFGQGYEDRGQPAGWRGFRATTSWADESPIVVVGSQPEPEPVDTSEVDALREQVAALRQQYDHDMRTIAEIMKEEADQREWCDEYEQVMNRINRNINADFTPAVREHDYTINFSGMVPFTGQIPLTLPHDPSEGQVIEAVREYFSGNASLLESYGSVDWSGVDTDELSVDEYTED